jgi:predicted unusual protein kinase regulating ubiquinone biosynthesis (AarF/ABC1/UbiB family)
MYRDRKDVKIPRPYSRLSNEDVIVMDYTPSKPITKPFKAEKLINMFLEQLLYEGVIAIIARHKPTEVAVELFDVAIVLHREAKGL